MKFLYLISALLATAVIAHAQALVAIAAIEFAIEIIAEESGETAVIEISNSFSISAEVGEEVTFSAEAIEQDAVGSVAGEAFEPTDMELTDIDPVDLDVEDETIQANLRWTQEIQVFGESYSIDFVTGVAGDVSVDANGVVTFDIEGELAQHGADITLHDPAISASIIDADSTVTFDAP